MRRMLTVLVVASALAALFVSASRAPRPTTERLQVVAISLTRSSCVPSPATFDPVCRSHREAERLRARFEKHHVSAAVHGRTVVLLYALP